MNKRTHATVNEVTNNVYIIQVNLLSSVNVNKCFFSVSPVTSTINCDQSSEIKLPAVQEGYTGELETTCIISYRHKCTVSCVRLNVKN